MCFILCTICIILIYISLNKHNLHTYLRIYVKEGDPIKWENVKEHLLKFENVNKINFICKEGCKSELLRGGHKQGKYHQSVVRMFVYFTTINYNFLNPQIHKKTNIYV